MTLFKYVDSKRFDILINKKIRFTQPDFFNDPFELLPFISQIMEESGFDNLIDSHVNSGQFIKENIEIVLRQNLPFLNNEDRETILKNEPFINSIKEQIPMLIAPIKNQIVGKNQLFNEEAAKILKQEGTKKLGILCLSECYDNLVMWSHYADCHRGFLIGFNSDHSFFDQRKSNLDEIRHIRKVNYAKERVPWTIMDEKIKEKESINNMISQIFLTKSFHWQNEKEWRMILPLNEASEINKEVHLFDFPPEIITEIIFGCKIDDKIQTKIIDLISKDRLLANIKIKKASLNFNEYSLAINELR